MTCWARTSSRAPRTCTPARKRWPWARSQALRDDDLITSTHRGHGHCHARGDSLAATPEAKQEHLNKMMAELCGRATGYCRGRGGSMHIADVEKGNLGATGIVGGNIPVATGAALSMKLQRHGPRGALLLRRRRLATPATFTSR